MSDNLFFNLLRELVTYSVFSDPGFDTSNLQNKLFSFGSGNRVSSFKTSSLMERLYLDKRQWEKTSDIDKVICLDFLIDQNIYNENKTPISDENLKAWIKDLIILAENNVNLNELTSSMESKIVLKRYFIDPPNGPPYRRPYLDDDQIILPQGEYVEFTRDLLNKIYWGKEVIKTAESILKCAVNEIKNKK